MPRIIVESGPARGRVVTLAAGKPVSVGRDAACVLSIPDEQASRLHFVIGLASSGWVVFDRSRNGMFVNGERLERKTLESGDLVRAGQTFVSFFDDEEDPLLGRLVGGYRIEVRLGRGGMGTVYRATQISLHRDVALKVLSRTLTSDREFVRRFVQEAQAAGRFNHANVVQVHDVGHEGDVYYLSMEYMPGGSLEEQRDQNGRLPPRRVLRWALDACRALVWAQGQGIVHRDIKPDNLLLDAHDNAKIADFGIAAQCRRSKTAIEGGKVMGTPRYMAPEQALGRPVDHRADIYALGSTVYTLLSGTPPYDGETAVDVLRAKLRSDPVPLGQRIPELPERLVAAVGRMMERRPEARFASAAEVHDVLAEICETEDLLDVEAKATPPSPSLAQESRLRAKRRGFIAAGIFVAAALVATGIVLIPKQTGPDAGASDTDASQAAPGGAAAVVDERASSTPTGDESPTAPNTARAAEVAGASTTPARDASAGSTAAARADGEKDNEALRSEILAIWKGKLSFAEASARLAEFERQHTAAEWKAPIENVRRLLAEDHAEGLQALARSLAADVAESIARGRFRTADEQLAALSDQQPAARAEVDAERERVSALARQALDAAMARATEMAGTAEHAQARKIIIDVVPSMPLGLQADALSGLETIEAAALKSAQAEEVLGEIGARVGESLRQFDVARAREAISSAARPEMPFAAARIDRIAAEVDAFDTIRRGFGESIAPGARILVGEGTRRRELRVLGFADGSLRVAEGAGRPETISLTDFSDEVLVRFLEGGARSGASDPVAVPGTVILPASVRERLGLFFLYGFGPRRAWALLTDAALGEATVASYRPRLLAALEKDLGAELARSVARSAAAVPGAAGAATLVTECAALRQMLAGSAGLGLSSALEREIAVAFVHTELNAIRARAPQVLFHTETVDVSAADGVVRAIYDFKDEGEKAALEPLLPGSGSARWVAKGALELKGEVRFLRGNPFHGRLGVKVSGRRGTRPFPDLSVVFWTRQGDRVSSLGASTSIISPDPYAPGVFVCGLGAGWIPSSSTFNGQPTLTTPRGAEVPLPADVALQLARSAAGDIGSRAMAGVLWASRSGRPYPQALAIEAAIDSSGRLDWRVNRQSLVNDLDAGVTGAVPSGSATLFAPLDPFVLTSLQVEGVLDPWWVEDEVLRLALAALRSVAPRAQLAPDVGQQATGLHADLSLPLEAPGRAFADSFDATLRAEWEVRSPDPKSHSLSRKPGFLSMRTHRGSIAGPSAGADTSRNFLLVRFPAEVGSDFEAITRLVGFVPETAGHEAGVICFDDEDNYVEGILTESRSKHRFVLRQESGGSQLAKESDRLPKARDVWIRLRKRGTSYRLLTSTDGIEYALSAEVFWKSDPPKYIGLVARRSDADLAAEEAAFDFFALVPPPPLPWAR